MRCDFDSITVHFSPGDSLGDTRHIQEHQAHSVCLEDVRTHTQRDRETERDRERDRERERERQRDRESQRETEVSESTDASFSWPLLLLLRLFCSGLGRGVWAAAGGFLFPSSLRCLSMSSLWVLILSCCLEHTSHMTQVT